MGIITKRCIWASKIHYLNDSEEFSIALDLAGRELKKRLEAEREGYIRFRLEDFLDQIRTIDKRRVVKRLGKARPAVVTAVKLVIDEMLVR